MKKIALDDLEMILDFEGPKLAANFQDFILYIWNFENEGPEDFDSGWLELDLSEDPPAFLDFFKGELSPRRAADRAKVSYGRLSADGSELVFDDGFRFEADLDDSPCPALTKGFRPKPFGIGGRLQFMFIQFGQVCDSVHLEVDGAPADRATYSEPFWPAFSRGLANVWENLCYAETGYVTLHADFFRRAEAFSKETGEMPPDSVTPDRGSHDMHFVRVGELMRVQHQRHTYWVRLTVFKKLFQALARRIFMAHRAALAADERVRQLALGEFPVPGVKRQLELATGLDPARYGAVYELLEEGSGDYEYAAVARMGSGVLGTEDLADLLERVRAMPPLQTVPSRRLQALSGAVPVEVRNGTLANYQQGYRLAAFVRQRLEPDAEVAPLDIESHMRALGLEIVDASFCRKILALAVWHKGNPRVCLNTGEIEANTNLRRSSLAHEFCHILVDRGGARPFGDLLDTEDNKDAIEQRARAFAAELLLPRKAAVEYLEAHAEAPDICHLALVYGVSPLLAANQVINAGRSCVLAPEWIEAAKDVQKHARDV